MTELEERIAELEAALHAALHNAWHLPPGYRWTDTEQDDYGVITKIVVTPCD